jgi:hypothetical protein
VVDLDAIKAKFQRNEFEFSQHAVDQTLLRHITIQEIREAIAASELIEDYPNDKYGPSCLLLVSTVLPAHFTSKSAIPRGSSSKSSPFTNPTQISGSTIATGDPRHD